MTETATFGGGCFWCLESEFQGLNGITHIISGYMGGHVKDPSYEQVSTGNTGHAEVVRIKFDPGRISYTTLLEIFFRQIDPTDRDGSFVDRGSQYRPIIFFHTPDQEKKARKMIKAIDSARIFDRPVATQVENASEFYPAEAYHQGYHRTNFLGYKLYRAGSGRDLFIEKFWAKAGRLFPEENRSEPVQNNEGQK